MPSCSHSSNGLAATAFGQVFAAFDPFGRSFASTVPRKLRIYETNPAWVSDQLADIVGPRRAGRPLQASRLRVDD